MTRFVLLLACAIILVGSVADAAVVEHTFNVSDFTVNLLCNKTVITGVNQQLPGPTLYATDGDTVIVHVINSSPYNITIHWHGIHQRQTQWADGPSYVTQCPIVPGGSYTYRFNIAGQEGTLSWHAHISFLRGTVYGAIIIRPKARPYPFPKPYKEVPILLGEWQKENLVALENEFIDTSGAVVSVGFTINGRLGDLYPCSSNDTYKLEVQRGKTYLLRIVGATLNTQLFFKIAGHNFTVVAIDARYTTPYATDVLVIAPGQTVDALLVANAPPGRYYMAASAYFTVNIPFDNTTTTGIVSYKSAPASAPVLPSMPAFNDTATAHRFFTSLTGLLLPGFPTVPLNIDEHMFVTVGLGVVPCLPSQTRCQRFALASSMNNVSLELPTSISLLEAHFKGVSEVYTSDFPDMPPVLFDFTNPNINKLDPALQLTVKETRVKRLKYNTTVEMVLQNTAILGVDNHPMHLHGYDFFVVAQGFGNYDPSSRTVVTSYNLKNPQVRNTIAVPVGGWAVIRFRADNPGMWLMHCHIELHVPWGLQMVFEVENGPTLSSTLPPPPPDFPTC